MLVYPIIWPIEYHLEYPIVECITEDHLYNNCSFWVRKIKSSEE